MVSAIFGTRFSSLTNSDLMNVHLSSNEEQKEWAEEVYWRLRNNVFKNGDITGDGEMKIFCYLWHLDLYPREVQSIARSCTVW
uniref:Uncharacterized protein n=1 Tax=Marseillevirus LCMAC101 TaxID=2506602 RepID=A0A481YS64_9VIRU|nr:MAG: hypothetical protein LCMAC101_06570 [Marseillevirus LCMAC101]